MTERESSLMDHQIDWGSEKGSRLFEKEVLKLLGETSSSKTPAEIGVNWFRKAGLLKPLILHFSGDPKQALEAILPPLSQKALLDLRNPRPGDELQRVWLTRVNQIAAKIHETQQRTISGFTKKAKKEAYRRGKNINLRIKKKRRVKKYMRQTIRQRIRKVATTRQAEKGLEAIVIEEAKDARSIFEQYLKRGLAACQILVDHDGVLPAYIAGKIGRKGKLYLVSPESDLEDKLFEGFLDVLVDFDGLKGNELSLEEKIRKKKSEARQGIPFIPGDFRRRQGRFLANQYLNEELYLAGFDFSKNTLPQRFYEYNNIIPMRSFIPPLPAEIDTASLDALVEIDKFSIISERKKQQLLWEMDRRLKVGGYLLFRERPIEQANIEYYGQELFSQKYQRVSPEEVRHPDRWLIFKKVNNEFDPNKIPEEQTLPLVKVGEEKEIEETIPTQETREEDFETEEIIYQAGKLPEKPSKREKDFYTLSEIAKKAGVSVKEVKVFLNNLGTKAVSYRGGTGGKRAIKGQFSFEEAQIIINSLKKE